MYALAEKSKLSKCIALIRNMVVKKRCNYANYR